MNWRFKKLTFQLFLRVLGVKDGLIMTVQYYIIGVH